MGFVFLLYHYRTLFILEGSCTRKKKKLIAFILNLYTTQLFFLHLSLIKIAANTQMSQALTSYVHQMSDINDLLIVACRIVVFYDSLGV